MRNACKQLGAVALVLAIALSSTAFVMEGEGDSGEAERSEPGEAAVELYTDGPVLSRSDASTTAKKREAIAGINPDRWGDGQAVMAGAASVSTSSRAPDLSELRVSPGAEIRFYLDADMFIDGDGNPVGDAGDGVELSELRKGRVTYTLLKSKGIGVFAEIDLAYDRERGTSYIKFECVDPLVSTARRGFKFTMRLRVNGVSCPETEVRVEGNVSNTEIKLEDAVEYIYVEANESINPSEFIRGVTVDVGAGMTIHLNMFGNKKYYASVRAVEVPQAKNAAVVMSYQFSHINMAYASVSRFDFDEQYYVYDGSGAYLGTSAEDLPVVRAYHFTREYVDELEVEGGGDGGRGGSGGRGNAEETDVALDRWSGDWNSLTTALSGDDLEAAYEFLAGDAGIEIADLKARCAEQETRPNVAGVQISSSEITLYDQPLTAESATEILSKADYAFAGRHTDADGQEWFLFQTEEKSTYPVILLTETAGDGEMRYFHIRCGSDAESLLAQSWYITMIA